MCIAKIGSLINSTVRIIHANIATSEGGGVCISLFGKHPILDLYFYCKKQFAGPVLQSDLQPRQSESGQILFLVLIDEKCSETHAKNNFLIFLFRTTKFSFK